jgi:hypothetical protein
LREQDVEFVSFGEARSSGRPCPTRRSRQERSGGDFDLEIEGVADERDLIADRFDDAPGSVKDPASRIRRAVGITLRASLPMRQRAVLPDREDGDRPPACGLALLAIE